VGNTNYLVDMNSDGIADVVLPSQGAPTVVLVDQHNHFSW
jgi:hypothetical protein